MAPRGRSSRTPKVSPGLTIDQEIARINDRLYSSQANRNSTGEQRGAQELNDPRDEDVWRTLYMDAVQNRAVAQEAEAARRQAEQARRQAEQVQRAARQGAGLNRLEAQLDARLRRPSPVYPHGLPAYVTPQQLHGRNVDRYLPEQEERYWWPGSPPPGYNFYPFLANVPPGEGDNDDNEEEEDPSLSPERDDPHDEDYQQPVETSDDTYEETDEDYDEDRDSYNNGDEDYAADPDESDDDDDNDRSRYSGKSLPSSHSSSDDNDGNEDAIPAVQAADDDPNSSEDDAPFEVKDDGDTVLPSVEANEDAPAVSQRLVIEISDDDDEKKEEARYLPSPIEISSDNDDDEEDNAPVVIQHEVIEISSDDEEEAFVPPPVEPEYDDGGVVLQSVETDNGLVFPHAAHNTLGSLLGPTVSLDRAVNNNQSPPYSPQTEDEPPIPHNPPSAGQAIQGPQHSFLAVPDVEDASFTLLHIPDVGDASFSLLDLPAARAPSFSPTSADDPPTPPYSVITDPVLDRVVDDDFEALLLANLQPGPSNALPHPSDTQGWEDYLRANPQLDDFNGLSSTVNQNVPAVSDASYSVLPPSQEIRPAQPSTGLPSVQPQRQPPRQPQSQLQSQSQRQPQQYSYQSPLSYSPSVSFSANPYLPGHLPSVQQNASRLGSGSVSHNASGSGHRSGGPSVQPRYPPLAYNPRGPTTPPVWPPPPRSASELEADQDFIAASIIYVPPPRVRTSRLLPSPSYLNPRPRPPGWIPWSQRSGYRPFSSYSQSAPQAQPANTYQAPPAQPLSTSLPSVSTYSPSAPLARPADTYRAPPAQSQFASLSSGPSYSPSVPRAQPTNTYQAPPTRPQLAPFPPGFSYSLSTPLAQPANTYQAPPAQSQFALLSSDSSLSSLSSVSTPQSLRANNNANPRLAPRPSAAAIDKMENTTPTTNSNGTTRGNQEAWTDAERNLLHQAATQWWHWRDNGTLPRSASSGAALYRYFEFVFAQAGLTRSYYQLKNQWSRNERAKFGRSEQRSKRDGTTRELVTSARPAAKARIQAEAAENARKRNRKQRDSDGDDEDDEDYDDGNQGNPRKAARRH